MAASDLNLIPVSDPRDPRLAHYQDVKDHWLKVQRGDHPTGMPDGLFMAEGRLVIEQLARSRCGCHSALVGAGALAAVRESLAGLGEGVPLYVAEPEVMNGVAGFDIHRGVLAVGVRPPEPELGALLSGAEVLVVCEELANHDNAGSIFRNTAALAGLGGAVLLGPRCCDPWYRKSIRVSVGQVLHVPFGWLDPWPNGLDRLAEAGYERLALTPSEQAEDIARVQPAGAGRKLALLLGAEGPGLSEGAMARCDRRVRIAVDPAADSLNVATTAAVALHRLARPNSSV